MSAASGSPLLRFAERLVAGVEADVDVVELRLLDAIAALLIGTQMDEGAAVLRLAQTLGGGGHQPQWSGGVLDAVAARVATTRLTEWDDIHSRSGMTPGSVVIPVAQAVADATGAGPDVLRRAIAGGYEAMARLGLAIGGPSVAGQGVWPTYFGAPFTAAAVTSVVLGLDTEATVQALQLALTRTAWASAAPMGPRISRWLTVGDAARVGCLAALAARDGFRNELDLDRFASTTGIPFDPSPFDDEVGRLAINETSVKPFPLAKQMVAAVEAARRLAAEIELDAIERVRLSVPAEYLGVIGRRGRDDSRLTRLSSGSWNLALALRRPECLSDPERTVPVSDPELAALAELVEIRADDTVSSDYPTHWPARLEIVSGGRSHETLVTVARGDPDGPEPARGVVQAKWAWLGQRAHGPDAEHWQRLVAAAVREPGALKAFGEALNEVRARQV